MTMTMNDNDPYFSYAVASRVTGKLPACTEAYTQHQTPGQNGVDVSLYPKTSSGRM